MNTATEANLIKLPVLRGWDRIEHLYMPIVEVGGIFAGGFVRYMVSPSDDPAAAGDVDIFASSPEAFEALQYAVNWKVSPAYEVVNENANAITFMPVYDSSLITVQLIKPTGRAGDPRVGDLATILDGFDFTVVRAGLLSPIEALADPCLPDHETERLLYLHNITNPLNTFFRANKYAAKGYFMPPAEAVRVLRDWEGRSEAYKEALIEAATSAPTTREQVERLEAFYEDYDDDYDDDFDYGDYDDDDRDDGEGW